MQAVDQKPEYHLEWPNISAKPNEIRIFFLVLFVRHWRRKIVGILLFSSSALDLQRICSFAVALAIAHIQ